MKNFFRKQFPLSTLIILFAMLQIGQYTCSQTMQFAAEQVIYNNSVSKLNAINVQEAIDEEALISKGVDERTSKNEGDIIGLMARIEQLEKRPSGSGGVCYTNYGQDKCAEGFNTIYSGVVAGSGYGEYASLSPYPAYGYGGFYCLSDTSLLTATNNRGNFKTMTGKRLAEDGSYLNDYTGNAIPCALCCK
jgi:hypothetical protein